MGKILILPDVLCNQIAAGEVIERPAAVVKELLENSIDAGSSKISLSLQQGGRREIRVVDNGSGMARDDALMALERHATSKIRNIEDLHSIRSLGFRGEALPSIASVSRFEMVTRTAQEVSGTFLRVDAGTLREVQDRGAPVGTVITVRDLFYNLPGRRKFLRSIDTEMGHIQDQFLRLALAHPTVHFQLAHQDRVLREHPSAADSLQRAVQILGVEVVRRLRPFSLDTPHLTLRGHLSTPELQRSSGQTIFTFLNGRPIWDRLVSRAILSAYESLLPRGKFPVVLLHLEVLPSLVDVNVHPTKREVRFRNPGEVTEAVRLALREALRGNPGIVTPAIPMEATRPLPDDCRRPGEAPHTGSAPCSPQEPALPAKNLEFLHQAALPSPGNSRARGSPPMLREQPRQLPSAAAAQPENADVAHFSAMRILGQIGQAYIVLESARGMVVVDQHAAHERIIYDRLCAGTSREPSQRLLRSVVLELLPRQVPLLRRWLGELKDYGFDLEPFGGNTFKIHAVPAIVGRCSPAELIRELLETAHEEEHRPHWNLPAQIARTAACHDAVKAGQRMTLEEVRHLLEELDRTAFPSTCPHGRPLWFEISREEMAQRFHRR